MNHINEAYQKTIHQSQSSLNEAKSSKILNELKKKLKTAKIDRKEFNGTDIDNQGKKTLAYPWQVELGDKKIASLESAIKSLEEYEKANAEWTSNGSV